LCDLQQTLVGGVTRLLDHAVEHLGVRHREQLVGRPELHRPAGIHHQHLVRVHDGVQPMGYGQHGALLELVADGGLDEAVRLGIHVGRGLVHHQDAVLAQDGPRQADQLALTHAKVGAPLFAKFSTNKQIFLRPHFYRSIKKKLWAYD